MKGEGIFVGLIEGGSKTTSWAASCFDRLAARISLRSFSRSPFYPFSEIVFKFSWWIKLRFGSSLGYLADGQGYWSAAWPALNWPWVAGATLTSVKPSSNRLLGICSRRGNALGGRHDSRMLLLTHVEAATWRFRLHATWYNFSADSSSTPLLRDIVFSKADRLSSVTVICVKHVIFLPLGLYIITD